MMLRHSPMQAKFGYLILNDCSKRIVVIRMQLRDNIVFNSLGVNETVNFFMKQIQINEYHRM